MSTCNTGLVLDGLSAWKGMNKDAQSHTRARLPAAARNGQACLYEPIAEVLLFAAALSSIEPNHSSQANGMLSIRLRAQDTAQSQPPTVKCCGRSASLSVSRRSSAVWRWTSFEDRLGPELNFSGSTGPAERGTVDMSARRRSPPNIW